jgi:hypothetical protein
VERGGVRDKPQDLVGHADAVEAAHRGEVKAAPVAAALLPCSRVVAADTLLPWSHGHRTYNLLDDGHDTVQANVELGLAVDSREYGIGAQVAKFVGLKGYGLAVVGRVPVISPITKENQRYLETKRTKMGHVYGSDLPGNVPEEFLNPDDIAGDQDEDDTHN